MHKPRSIEEFNTLDDENKWFLYYAAMLQLNRIGLHWEACVSDEACELTEWMGKMKEFLDEF
jgi:hypothetical protein